LSPKRREGHTKKGDVKERILVMSAERLMTAREWGGSKCPEQFTGGHPLQGQRKQPIEKKKKKKKAGHSGDNRK